MKSVLFATDHMTPNRKALDYALLLCRRMTAGLEVLHILRVPPPSDSPGNHRHPPIQPSGDAAVSAMVTVAAAESGAHDPPDALRAAAYDQFKGQLPDQPDTRIDYRCLVAGEPAGTIIERYVRNHRHIVLAVFDPTLHRDPSGALKKETCPAGVQVMPKLSIPVVLVKNAPSIPTRQEDLRHAKSIQEREKEHPRR